MRGTRQGIAIVLAVAVSAGVACGSEGQPASDRLQVVTTVSPVTNLVQNIAGDKVDLTGIVPEGVNSHTFEPAPSDAAVMERADLVFMNGLHLEEPTRVLAEANVPEGATIVELGPATISEDEYIYDSSFPESGGDPNPHLWTNPPYAKRYAQIIADELSAADPSNAPFYAANYEALARQFDTLDAAAREVTATVPPSNRKLLTYHDSFPYFAREYGWEIIGAVQPADFAEPTPQELVTLIDQVKAERVPAIFGSEVFPSPVLETIASETGANYVDDLRDDDLPGEAGEPNHSLASLLVDDFTTFMGALGGDTSGFERVDAANLLESPDAEYAV